MRTTNCKASLFAASVVKAVVVALVFLGVASAKAELVTNLPARFKIKVTCYDGKIGSGVSVSSVHPTPEATLPGTEDKSVGTSPPGHEFELRWVFLGRNKDKDVYQFTFAQMANSPVMAKQIASKECAFDGQKMILFEDDLHTVVVETPTAEDLKNSKPGH